MNNFIASQEHYEQVFEKIQFASGERLTGEFTDCQFVQCSFEAAVLRSCRFSSCIFQQCNLSLAEIPGCSFPDTRFEKSKLLGINWTQADWSSAGFSNLIGFFDCVISHSTFIGLELKGIQVKNCVAHEVDFRDADLSKVNFRGTDLAKSLFNSTNLTKANLSQAKNYQIDPGNNTLTQAKFSLPEAMALLYSMDILIQEPEDAGW